MLHEIIFVNFLFCMVSSNTICEDCSNNENEIIDWSLNELNQEDPKLIKILQEKYLIRPSKKQLNLTRPASNRSLKGQYGQPLLLDEKYFRGKKKNGFFIEAGAYDGEMISNTLYFELRHQWSGLLIEPNEWHFQKLLLKHRKAWSMGYCLSTKKHPEVVVFDNSGLGSGIVNTETNISPVPEKYKIKEPYKRLQKQCFPIFSLLLALGNPTVDYFSLDVEGTEIDILRTIPWDKVDIKAVGVEINHLGQVFEGNITDLDTLMSDNGFKFLAMADIDKFYVKKKAKKKQKSEL